jgi:hypothetical protein
MMTRAEIERRYPACADAVDFMENHVSEDVWPDVRVWAEEEGPAAVVKFLRETAGLVTTLVPAACRRPVAGLPDPDKVELGFRHPDFRRYFLARLGAV